MFNKILNKIMGKIAGVEKISLTVYINPIITIDEKGKQKINEYEYSDSIDTSDLKTLIKWLKEINLLPEQWEDFDDNNLGYIKDLFDYNSKENKKIIKLNDEKTYIERLILWDTREPMSTLYNLLQNMIWEMELRQDELEDFNLKIKMSEFISKFKDFFEEFRKWLSSTFNKY
ncbi:hypothetical protein [Mycoplasma sp. 1012]